MNTQGKRPYTHLYLDVSDKLALLARRANAVVFLAVGVLAPKQPAGVSVKDINAYTGIDERTIETALTLLERSGLIRKDRTGNFISGDYMEYRKPTNNLSAGTMIDSINRQSDQNQINLNQSVVHGTVPQNKEFSTALQALDAALLGAGRGMTPQDYSVFGELWDEYPDAELHARALGIMRKKADKPNFRYYVRVVQTGAVDYDAAKKEPDVVAVTL